MSAIIDVLGALVIGGMLMLMMFTFQHQLADTTNSMIYLGNMIEHMQITHRKLNSIISLVGIGIDPNATVITADSTLFVFDTRWNYQTDRIGASKNRISLGLSNIQTPQGKPLTISMNGTILRDLGYIFWIDHLLFKYYDLQGQSTSVPSSIRSVEICLTFRYNAPGAREQTLRTKLQMRCYFMNSYLAVGTSTN